jgi:hypothetical protein
MDHKNIREILSSQQSAPKRELSDAMKKRLEANKKAAEEKLTEVVQVAAEPVAEVVVEEVPVVIEIAEVIEEVKEVVQVVAEPVAEIAVEEAPVLDEVVAIEETTPAKIVEEVSQLLNPEVAEEVKQEEIKE